MEVSDPPVKRDYVDGAEARDAESVLALLSGWIEDYKTRAPYSALGCGAEPTNNLWHSP